MKSTLLLAFACLSALPVHALADPSDDTIGLGLGVGVATGPNVQFATSRGTQLDLGFGYQLDEHFRFQTDHAWRLADLSSSWSLALPLYLGVGGFFTDRHDGTADVGLRMPIGLQADFRRAPIQLFAELAPELVVAELDRGTMAPPGDVLALSGLMGVRAAL
jgi:hypothetical protein